MDDFGPPMTSHCVRLKESHDEWIGRDGHEIGIRNSDTFNCKRIGCIFPIKNTSFFTILQLNRICFSQTMFLCKTIVLQSHSWKVKIFAITRWCILLPFRKAPISTCFFIPVGFNQFHQMYLKMKLRKFYDSQTMKHNLWLMNQHTFSYSAAIWVRNGVASDMDSKSFKQFMFIIILSWISVGRLTKFNSGWFSLTFMLPNCAFNASHLLMHLKYAFKASFGHTFTHMIHDWRLKRLYRCWWRMWETKCVGDKFEMLISDSGCWLPI